MATIAPLDTRVTAREYLTLVERGLLGPDDKVELLEGVIVAMSPPSPLHASVGNRIHLLLHDLLRGRAVVRGQTTFIAGEHSVPEPDVAVVAWREDEYEQFHPSEALLVVEVAASSLPQDRLTQSRIYAAAGVPEYWIVNLRDDQVEVLRRPDASRARYEDQEILGRGDRVTLMTFPDVTIHVTDLLPRQPTQG
jgi:Uma2 family endonuclease